MSAKEFKEYLDKTGVLEFLNTNVSKNKKNQKFKELLEKAGVPEFLDLVLTKLYEEPDKPSDALEYIKKSIGGAKAHKEEIAKLSYENADLKKKIEELEKTEAELKEKIMDAADAPTNNANLNETLVVVPNINSCFCDELLVYILSLLPPRDLMSAVLVCKRWHRIGEGSHLWFWVNFEANLADMPHFEEKGGISKKMLKAAINHGANLADMPKILGLPRLAQLKRLTLEGISKFLLETIKIDGANLTDMPKMRLAQLEKLTLEGISDKTLEAIQNHQGLKTLKLLRCNVSMINSDLLARVMTKMEEVRLVNTDLNTNQWNAFCNSMLDDTKLKKLEIKVRSLTQANPQSLAEAVSKLEMFKLVVKFGWASEHSKAWASEHSKALFKQLAIKSKMKSLWIENTNLTSVEEPSLVTVLRNLEEAAFPFTDLNARQSTAIIGLVAAGKSDLKVLDLSGNDLQNVNPTDMAKAVGKMETICLRRARLTNEQCKQIFMYAQGYSNLKVLDISWNNLSSVEPGSLAKTVNKMEKCDLSGSKLITPQLEAIFKHLNEGCKLKELDVHYNNLSEVEGDVLSKAIVKLVEVDIDSTQLTTHQLEALFMEIKRSRRKLKILRLYGTNLRSVKIDNLVGALGCLEVLHLRRDSLTPEQWDAVKSIPGLRHHPDYVTVD